MPPGINCVNLPAAAPQDALPLMYQECRVYYAKFKPLSLEEVKPERARLSVVKGH